MDFFLLRMNLRLKFLKSHNEPDSPLNLTGGAISFEAVAAYIFIEPFTYGKPLIHIYSINCCY